MRGDRPRFVEFANYRYTTGSGKNKTTHTWGYVAVKLDVPLPHIVLDAKGNNGIFGSNLPATFDKDQRLSLEGDFDEYFSLYCPQGYEPDALYLFTPDIMARFIDNVRSLSIDPVVVRQNWLKAYDFVTDRAAVTLNEYARDNDPFAKVGRETVAVEVTSVVRASDTSFQMRWLERIFEGGALKDTKRLTGLFSIVITPPRTVDAMRKNPLGIYVHTFNWSQDVNAGESK